MGGFGEIIDHLGRRGLFWLASSALETASVAAATEKHPFNTDDYAALHAHERRSFSRWAGPFSTRRFLTAPAAW